MTEDQNFWVHTGEHGLGAFAKAPEKAPEEPRPLECWRTMISDNMSEHGDAWENVEACTLTEEALDRKFDFRHGCAGTPFFVWTKTRVYFAASSDWAEWCASVPRNPSYEKPSRIG